MGEVCRTWVNLTWNDIDWNEKIAWVWSAKNRMRLPERQPVFLSEKAMEILQEIRKGNPPKKQIFINPVTGEPFKSPKSTLSRAIKRLGLPMRGVHDLRHLFASRLIESGMDNITASLLMRHRDVRMMSRYTHLSSSHLHERLNEALNNDNGMATDEKKEE